MTQKEDYKSINKYNTGLIMNKFLTIDFPLIYKQKGRSLFAGPKNGKILLKKLSPCYFLKRNRYINVIKNNDIVVSSSFYFGLLNPLFKGKNESYIREHLYLDGVLYKKNDDMEIERAIRRILSQKKNFIAYFF